jgi:hypothetical protein
VVGGVFLTGGSRGEGLGFPGVVFSLVLVFGVLWCVSLCASRVAGFCGGFVLRVVGGLFGLLRGVCGVLFSLWELGAPGWLSRVVGFVWLGAALGWCCVRVRGSGGVRVPRFPGRRLSLCVLGFSGFCGAGRVVLLVRDGGRGRRGWWGAGGVRGRNCAPVRLVAGLACGRVEVVLPSAARGRAGGRGRCWCSRYGGLGAGC